MPAKKKELPKNIRLTKLYFYVDGNNVVNELEIDFSDQSCWLLVGKNGSGKTRIGEILTIFHRIGTGETDFFKLFDSLSCSCQGDAIIKLEGKREGIILSYEIKLVCSVIYEERVYYQDKMIFERADNELKIHSKKILMKIDHHSLGFPTLDGYGFDEVKDFLSRISILHPVPSQLLGASSSAKIRTVFSHAQGSPKTNLWHQNLMKENPHWCEKVEKTKYRDLELTPIMQKIWSDLEEITSSFSNDSYSLDFKFKNLKNSLNFNQLSDGERIFFMTALLLAELKRFGPRICYWDEPEKYLAPSKIAPQISLLKGSFKKAGGQFIAASHNPLTMDGFSREQIQVLTTEGRAETPKVQKATNFSLPEGMNFSEAYTLELLDEC